MHDYDADMIGGQPIHLGTVSIMNLPAETVHGPRTSERRETFTAYALIAFPVGLGGLFHFPEAR